MRLKNWCFCNSTAINRRDLVIQANTETCIGFTGSGRIIIARCKAGRIGQAWTDGEFIGDSSGVGYAYFGENGSENFAEEIRATKSCPADRFEVCPQLPHHQFSEEGAVSLYPGVMEWIQACLAQGNFYAAKNGIDALQTIASFARQEDAWHYMDLE